MSRTENTREDAADSAIDPVAFPRRHPCIFTRAEAAAHLGLKSTQSLRTLEKEFGLRGRRPAGKEMLFYVDELDACARKMFGKDQP